MAIPKFQDFHGKTLADYMFEYNVGVSEKRGYVVKKLDSDYFED
jgi:restriction endonuclease Mrr